MAMVTQQLERLDQEERDAWEHYLTHTRGAKLNGEQSYQETESWAWAALRATLLRVKRERKRLTG